MQLSYNYSAKPFEVYCPFDPAIDQEKSEIEKYIETKEVKYLHFKPDCKPTKFFLKNIDRGLLINYIYPKPSNMHVFLAFQYGIEHIENLQEIYVNPGVIINNNGLSIWEPTELLTLKSKKIKYISDEDLENLFHLNTILEIGNIVLKKTQSMNGIKTTYPILRTSIEIIERMKS